MHSYFSPSASGLLVLKCTQPIDSGKKRLQVSIVIKATRQWMVLTPTMIRCKKSFLRLLPSFYVSIVPPASTTTWSSILTVDAQWKICRKFLAFPKLTHGGQENSVHSHQIPYKRCYKPRLAYFLPHFSIRLVLYSGWCYRQFMC